MKNSEKFQKAFHFFKKEYRYKMGGTQTVILPNGKSQYFDDREYYSGRGSKYNSSINHDNVGDVKVTRKEYSQFLAKLKEREILRLKYEVERKEKHQRIEKAKENGVYSLSPISENGQFIELSDDEKSEQYFDENRLAKTLGIKVEDALLLNSTGKTYVFTKSNTGVIYELYHPSLSCNDLTIWVREITEDRLKQFNHDEWYNAPYAHLLGQTKNKNHFVC